VYYQGERSLHLLQHTPKPMTDVGTKYRDVDSKALTRRLYEARQKSDDEVPESGINIEWAKGILDIVLFDRKEEFSTNDINAALKRMPQEDSLEATLDLLWLCLYNSLNAPIHFSPRIPDDLRNTQLTTIYFNVWLSNWDDSPSLLVVEWKKKKPSRRPAGEGCILKVYQDDGGEGRLREFFEDLKQLGETTILVNQEFWRQYELCSPLSRK
jgi:hypothetical protein